LIPFIGICQLYTPGGGVTDIDGNTYQTIIINGQEWMAENLRTSTYANGDPIPNVTDDNQWSNLTTGAWVHYNNDSQYENPYGKLYNWYTVADPRNVCPTGWHVPTDSEYTLLTDYLGGELVAGTKMKNTSGWYNNGNGTNESGFSGLPGGFRIYYFESDGYDGRWWSSTEYSVGVAVWYRGLSCFQSDLIRLTQFENNGYSVRCLNNSTLSINEIIPSLKTLIKVFNMLGNETVITPNELQFYLYSDGSIEKKIVIEK
jgi:uncharacterized protein (TIGR02145 family)